MMLRDHLDVGELDIGDVALLAVSDGRSPTAGAM
jgi:hypothetical protein